MLHKCPSRLDDEAATSFINEIKNFKDVEELIIDFSTLNFVFPYATLLLAENVRELIEYRLKRGLETLSNSDSQEFNNAGAIPYLKHVGFFQFIGLPYGKMPNEAPGNENYIPICKLTEERLQDEYCERIIQNAITLESERIVRTIFPNPEECIMLAYCFREIIRNVFEHANINYCTIMAQKWHRGQVAEDVEIAIVDRGRGIFNSMSESYQLNSVEQAITEALKPGISRVQEPQNKTEWDNTGFGLFVISQLGLQYGEFSICSNGKLLNISQYRRNFSDINFQGTAIKLRMNTRDAEYFPNILQNIITQGEEQFQAHAGYKKSASKSSKIL